MGTEVRDPLKGDFIQPQADQSQVRISILSDEKVALKSSGSTNILDIKVLGTWFNLLLQEAVGIGVEQLRRIK